MKTKLFAVTVLALLFSVGDAQAQNQPDVHIARIRPTPEDRMIQKTERKATVAAMKPAERKAFKKTHRDQRQARLDAMMPKKRLKVEERRRVRKETKKAGR